MRVWNISGRRLQKIADITVPVPQLIKHMEKHTNFFQFAMKADTMTCIQILSDLHLEAPKSYDVFEITPVSSYLALIGDIGCIKDPEYFTFLKKQLSIFKIVFVLLGNHEPYHSDWGTAVEKLRQLEKETNEASIDGDLGSLIFMDRKRYDLSPDTTILGCTLFSRIPSSQMMGVSFGLNDFYHINNWTVEQHNVAHTVDLNWLNAEVKSISETEPNRKIIILTHYSPTTSSNSIDPAHAQSKISSGFSSDLTGEICWTNRSVVAWAFGHTHWNCDYVDEGTGKRIVTNQRGYYFSQSPGYDEKKCVEF